MCRSIVMSPAVPGKRRLSAADWSRGLLQCGPADQLDWLKLMPIEGACRAKWPRPTIDTGANSRAIKLQRPPLFGREKELINYQLKTMDGDAQVPLPRDWDGERGHRSDHEDQKGEGCLNVVWVCVGKGKRVTEGKGVLYRSQRQKDRKERNKDSKRNYKLVNCHHDTQLCQNKQKTQEKPVLAYSSSIFRPPVRGDVFKMAMTTKEWNCV